MKKESQNKNAGNFANAHKQILGKSSSFAVQEAYKTLRTNVRFSLRNGQCKKFCITSGAPGEGKSITVLNLAISLAETGDKVLLIDADMRRPAQASLLDKQASPGLSDVLAGIAVCEEAIHKEEYPNLDVMLSGEVPPNPSELLGSERMGQMIEEMAEHYDYILIDTPPVNVVSDACIIANLLDGVLLLVRKDRARKDDIKRALSSLRLTGAKVLGYIFNGVILDSGKSYKYYN
jgi:capsular exopolysaccharide synthesis family protein